ncbi:unnamed protein product [Schistosoma intercalatum]|nr:unnamed protein product [Schistosoma intercalatum]
MGFPNWLAFLLVRFFLGLVSAVSASLLSSTVATYIYSNNQKQMGELDLTKRKETSYRQQRFSLVDHPLL